MWLLFARLSTQVYGKAKSKLFLEHWSNDQYRQNETNNYLAADTIKDRMVANDSYENSEKHSLQRCVLLLCYYYGFHSCSFCNIKIAVPTHLLKTTTDSCFVGF